MAAAASSSAAAQNKQLAACKTLARNSEPACSRLSILPLANGPKRSMGHLLGAKKINFFNREIDDAAMAGASMETCQFVVLKSLGDRFWMLLDVRKRRRRVRGRFHRWIHISTGAWQCADNYHDPPKFWIQSSLESPKHRRIRRRRLPDPRPTPEGVREPICIRKK